MEVEPGARCRSSARLRLALFDLDQGEGCRDMLSWRPQKAEVEMLRLLCLLMLGSMPVAAQDAEAGRVLYMRHCATCHGETAKGDGPMAPVLTLVPPGLTALARDYGQFPVARVMARIDGREPLVAHGSRMPVYGTFFDETEQVALKTPAGQPVMMPVPIADLVVFLKSVQE